MVAGSDGWVWPEGGKGRGFDGRGRGLRDGGGIWMAGVWSKGGQRRGWAGTRTAWGRGRAGPGGGRRRPGAQAVWVSDAEVLAFAGLGGRRRRRRRAQRRLWLLWCWRRAAPGRGLQVWARPGPLRAPRRGHESGPSAWPPRRRGRRAGPAAGYARACGAPGRAARPPGRRRRLPRAWVAARPRSARCSTCCGRSAAVSPAPRGLRPR